jgi:hypothetical protein
MDTNPQVRDLDPLVAALDDLAAGARAISGCPPGAWQAIGSLNWDLPPAGPLLTCALCGMPITAPYRRATDGTNRTAHFNRKECLETIRDIAVFALDTTIGTEPEPPLPDDPPF